jgi:PAS domain S-box-containing protein
VQWNICQQQQQQQQQQEEEFGPLEANEWGAGEGGAGEFGGGDGGAMDGGAMGGAMVPINRTTGTTPTKEVANNLAEMLKRSFNVSTFTDTANHLQKQCGSNHTFTISDSSRRLVFVSDAFCLMTGYTEEECLNRNCSFLQGPETSLQTVDLMRSELVKGNGIDVEILNYKKDGTPFMNFLVIEPVKATSGSVLYYVGVQLDSTAVDSTRNAGADWACTQDEFRGRRRCSLSPQIVYCKTRFHR